MNSDTVKIIAWDVEKAVEARAAEDPTWILENLRSENKPTDFIVPKFELYRKLGRLNDFFSFDLSLFVVNEKAKKTMLFIRDYTLGKIVHI